MIMVIIVYGCATYALFAWLLDSGPVIYNSINASVSYVAFSGIWLFSDTTFVVPFLPYCT